MKYQMIGFVLAAALSVAPALADSPSVADAAFVTKASVGDLFEQEEAKLALAKATNPRLKTFAQDMINQHADAQNKLNAAAAKAGDQPASMLDPIHQAMLDNLKSFIGTDFDKIYLADQLQAHVETVALLSDYQQNGQNSELRSWTKMALPIVKGHLAAIDGL